MSIDGLTYDARHNRLWISLQSGDTTSSDAKPAGPAISGTSNRVALSGAGSATVFTHSIPVDDKVFLTQHFDIAAERHECEPIFGVSPLLTP